MLQCFRSPPRAGRQEWRFEELGVEAICLRTPVLARRPGRSRWIEVTAYRFDSLTARGRRAPTEVRERRSSAGRRRRSC